MCILIRHNMNSPINIAIFASGNGTNMQAITDFFAHRPEAGIRPALVVSDNPDAYVLRRAEKEGIPSVVLNKSSLGDRNEVMPILEAHRIGYIILAGYLRLIPEFLLEAYPGKILNIHPALLPKYGGKGMYGHHVHEAVKAAGEKVTGITIHEIDADYDRGKIVFQAETPIDSEADSTEDIAAKVHLLEHEFFPKTIGEWIARKEAKK